MLNLLLLTFVPVVSSGTDKLKGFYTPSSQSLVVVDNYEKTEDNVPINYKTSTFLLDGDEPIFVGTESVSITVKKK